MSGLPLKSLLTKVVRRAARKVVGRQPLITDLVHAAVSRVRRPGDVPVESMPWLLGMIYDVEVPHAVVPNAEPSPSGGANINIIFDLVAKTRGVAGDLAECGVFRGGTLVPTALYVKQHGIGKRVFGFDSFEGFDDAIDVDLKLAGAENRFKKVGGFSGTSYELVAAKLALFGVSDVAQLTKGYFRDTLQRCSERQFSFVHLDCDIYESYKECLEFFYPRLPSGAIVLFDEYNDPPWPGCNKAIDEFLQDKPEDLVLVESDNQQKWYFRKV